MARRLTTFSAKLQNRLPGQYYLTYHFILRQAFRFNLGCQPLSNLSRYSYPIKFDAPEMSPGKLLNMEPFGFDRLPEVVKQLFEKVEYLEELLKKIQPTEGPVNKMLSVSDAATFLGISTQAVYTMVSRGVIPYHKPGKRLYFDRQDLEEWIRLGRISSSSIAPTLPVAPLRRANRRR